ncbi:hypothetical protein Poli38472_001937 [Pythium oligandrum]|uniref:Uncharacterized protein n=1 Tax=Pythium oligandrum TaxID=41045 RepID=A0A8K1FNU9_PYTOL|nr:hypothetical protein Poli38472_001937 [Pythium oligandrum]|eukprot:TMW69781.1 hypothetical protein Poli38472_001937 [Pythium oligandrum]
MATEGTRTPLLKEEDAWRIALAWQEPLQEHVRLIHSTLKNRIVRSYEWVALRVNDRDDLGILIDQVHAFKAACTVWFALSYCPGYSGRENPSFWKRVFGKLRESRLPPSQRVQPQSEHQDVYSHAVTDANRFFDEDGVVFPRIQLFVERFYESQRDKEAALLQFFFYGSEDTTPTMERVEHEMKDLLEELMPFVEHSRVHRVIPVTLGLSTFTFPNDVHAVQTLLATLPTDPSFASALQASIHQPVFLVHSLSYCQYYVKEDSHLESLQTFFRSYPVEVAYVNLLRPRGQGSITPHVKLLLGTDPSIQIRVKHLCVSGGGDGNSHLAAQCSALPHASSLEMLTLSLGNSVQARNWAWVGYALFHPDGHISSWPELKLLLGEMTSENGQNIKILEAMAMGNNLLAIQSGLEPQNTVYHTAILRSGSVIRSEPRPDADVLLTVTEVTSVDVALLSNNPPAALPEWVGVIVPSYGLGWTLSSDIFQLTSRPPSPTPLKSLALVSKQIPSEVLVRFLALVGPNLQFLDIGTIQELDTETLSSVLQLCSSLISLRVCHDGGLWTRDGHEYCVYPQLEELSLRLPSLRRSAVPRREYSMLGASTTQALSTYLAPSRSSAWASLRHLKTLRLEASTSEDFEQSRSAIQHALVRLPSLEYFRFHHSQGAAKNLNEPLSYAEARKLSWDRVGLSSEEMRWSQFGQFQARLLSFLSVTSHPATLHSAVQRVDRDVTQLIFRFAMTELVDLWIENEGNEVEWLFHN